MMVDALVDEGDPISLIQPARIAMVPRKPPRSMHVLYSVKWSSLEQCGNSEQSTKSSVDSNLQAFYLVSVVYGNWGFDSGKYGWTP